MRIVALVVVTHLFVSTSPVQAQYKSIDEIKLDKIGMNSSLEDFLKFHPEAKSMKNLPGAQYGIKTYLMSYDEGGTLYGYDFLDGKLYMMSVHWNNKGLQKAGPVIQNVDKKYGPCTDSKPDCLIWDGKKTSNTLFIAIPEGDRWMHLWLKSKKVSERLDKIKERMKKNDQ